MALQSPSCRTSAQNCAPVLIPACPGSAEDYVESIKKEQRWLPRLAGRLPLPIPVLLGKGRPGWVILRAAPRSPGSSCPARAPASSGNGGRSTPRPGCGWAIWKVMIVLVSALEPGDQDDAAYTTNVIGKILAGHLAG